MNSALRFFVINNLYFLAVNFALKFINAIAVLLKFLRLLYYTSKALRLSNGKLRRIRCIIKFLRRFTLKKRLITVLAAAVFAFMIPFAFAGCKKDDKKIRINEVTHK